MKFEVSAATWKPEIYNCGTEHPSAEGKLSAQRTLFGQRTTTPMAEVDAPHLCFRSNYVDKEAANDTSVREWTPLQVIDWLTSMNLYSSIDCFKAKSITGAQLFDLTDTSLLEMGIGDAYQRKTLMTCLDEICGRRSTEEDSEGSSTESSDECTSDSSEHDLREHVFSTSVKCHKCGKYIVQGALQQGYQCTVCGLCLHTECTKGKIQACNSEKLETRKKLHLQSHSNGPPFGSDLCKDVAHSRYRTVPDIIYVCTQEIERQSNLNQDLNVIDAYKNHKSSEDICSLRRAFDASADAFAVPVMDMELSTLCGVIKKYLRELTNPLIPTEWYDEFINAAQPAGESESIAAIGLLVNELPKYHNSTLHFLFSHFYKILANGPNRDDNAYLSLSQTFCHIILRPDWSDIMNLVDNTQFHVIVLRKLLSLHDNNNTECDKNMNPTASSVTQDTAHGAGAVCHLQSENLFSHVPQYEERLLPLEQYPWYWAEVSREEVQEATVDVEDGSFLVRNATSHSTHGDYTLVLRKADNNLLIKIYHRRGQYGFCADSCPFESVPSLVSYYQHHSLAEYNAKLNLRLRRGIARHSQYDSLLATDPQLLLKQLKRNHAELMSLTQECDSLLEKQMRMSHDIQLLHQAQESFKELSKIFEEQIEQYAHPETRSENSSQGANEAQRNTDILQARLHSINVNKDQLGHTIQEKTGDNSILAIDISTIKPTLRTLSRKQDHIINALLSQGLTRHELEHILHGDPHPHTSHATSRLEPPASHSKKTESLHNPPHDLPHMHKSSWFVNCSRAEAIERLQHCKDGTFLLRPGSQDNHPYSLSISINGMVGHCKVLHQDGHYGFADPYILYDSLVELVLHYKDRSLAHHNPQLSTKLLYPINCS